MTDFTVFDVVFPAAAKQRVIVNTDAKNEADDQYAIVHAVLTPSYMKTFFAKLAQFIR